MSVHLDVSLQLKLHQKSGQRSFEFNLELKREINVLAFFGPSGAGKTVALRALAGLIRPTHGSLIVDDETWTDTSTNTWRPAHKRQVGYVPQSSALFPHLSILENVCFGLEGPDRRAPPSRVHELIERMNLERLATSFPMSLSGGERQRVSLARALARAPRLLLLDEPMSALDDAARVQLRSLLQETIEDLGIATILVTHDLQEASTMATEVLLFKRGRTDRVIDARDLHQAAAPIHIEGQLKGTPEPLPDGRVRASFEHATITADPTLLAQANEDHTSD